mmetsp:Transcript_7134/g.20228  ORF Transcript_7134/g.20228 Transcript_7134/m.20228 type:complete len:236 (+) Transcript_7134:39-746(+)|eukprot:CAMPEP_0119133764 /NCGR_PEP_ID=MMETSP1310-20130426/13543_1 /TAXON_ID=464262 /ORGANISM="Genus nov. species nov., Strain RCC2339" /LENGTH=235 /DNA_ID=CAMNT_0007124465 /DNA_START=39 /DNA_END=746 /DNA_ORIENTATION=-
MAQEMGQDRWAGVWDDISSGGPQRWRAVDEESEKVSFAHIEASQPAYLQGAVPTVFCPLAGDDKFAAYAFRQGWNVRTLEWVSKAVERMRAQIGPESEWTRETVGDHLLWRHTSGRAVLYEGDMFTTVDALVGAVDVVYDKDSFGALQINDRPSFVSKVGAYVKPGGIIYSEVKYKDTERDRGPPFHLDREAMESTFASHFSYEKELGELYPLKGGGLRANWKQTGHILRRTQSP